jgi:hypothetical protein
MEATILCKLLAQRISPEKFQLWGTEIHFINVEDDTPANRAIVAAVIENYAALAAAYSTSQAMETLRQKRNARLQETDWTQLPDSPLPVEKSDKWRIYRQGLRDLPAVTTDPANPIWPPIPAA